MPASFFTMVRLHAEHVEATDGEDKELVELERQINKQKKVTQVWKALRNSQPW